MNFKQLKTFYTILNEKSMTTAARKLLLTQPAVSQQIKQLEDYMGVDLLVKGIRKVKPTPQGELLYGYSQRILKLSHQAELAIQTMGVDASGPLRVGTLNSIGLNLLGPVFSMFLKGNGKVRLLLKYDSGFNLLKMLETEEIDLVVIPDANKEFGVEPKDVDKFVLAGTEIVFVTSGKDRVANNLDLKDINNKPVIMMTQQYPGFESFLIRELKKVGINSLKPMFESSNVGTLKRLIETQTGWGFLPLHSVQKHIQSYRLKRINIREFTYPMNMVCYRSKTRANDPTSDVFIKALINQQTNN